MELNLAALSNPSQSGLDLLVKEYLAAKGYTKALEALSEESHDKSAPTPHTVGSSSTAAPSSSSGNVATEESKQSVEALLANAAQSLYVNGVKEGDASVYLHEFTVFHTWAIHSIDLIHPYLEAVSFVTFVCCYIGLIRFGFENKAKELWNKFHNHYRFRFAEEMDYVFLLTSKGQLSDMDFLSDNKFIQSALSEKFTIEFSNLAFQVLSSYLSQNNLVLIAAIINDKIQFDKVKSAGDRSTLHVDSNSLITLPGFSPAGARPLTSVEQNRLEVGVPGSGRFLKTLAERNPALFENIKIPGIEALNASVSATGVPSLYKAWMEHLVRPNMVFEKALKRKKGEIDDMDTKLITTDTSNIDIANGLDPSIIFATVGNANDGMTCMDINKDITQVVTGHSDCIVRVWRMDTTNADLAEGQNNSNMPFGSLLREKGCNDHWEMDDIRPKPLKAFERQNNGNKDKNQSFGKGKFPMLEFVGHDLPVYSVHQSHFLNSRLVVSTSADQTIRLWDTAVVQCVNKIKSNSVAWSVQFHPFDYYFCTGNADRSVAVYTTDRIHPVRLMTGHGSDVNVVQWHDNGILLASGSDDRSVRLWDLRTAENARILRGCNSPVSSLAISSIGNLLAAGTDNGNIYLWDIRSSRQLGILHGHQGDVYSIAFSADNVALASGGADCSVRTWDLLPLLDPAYATDAQNNINKVLRPKHTFFTKASPVYNLGYTPRNVMYAGGCCSFEAAMYPKENVVPESSVNNSQNASTNENEFIRKMGLSAVKSLDTSMHA